MGTGKSHDRALELIQRAMNLQMAGDLDESIRLYRESIAVCPTADAHTYLGWAYSFQGRIDDAIAECEIAIKLDPEFGNPYNDIGVYLLNQGHQEEAVPWLEKAIASKRYCCYQFPHANLGRILLMQGKVEEAKRSFERALEYDPQYLPALLGLEFIRRGGLQGL